MNSLILNFIFYFIGSLRYELHKKAKASLGAGEQIRSSVKLPPGEEENEWLAVHGSLLLLLLFLSKLKFIKFNFSIFQYLVVDFFNRVNLIYGTLSDFCTTKTCPRMTAGTK